MGLPSHLSWRSLVLLRQRPSMAKASQGLVNVSRQASNLSLPQQKVDIGSREGVGFGANGEVTYIDSVMAPFPAIRLKEQGDWKKLTLEEKNTLYRASFCQTLAEVEAPSGDWKSIIGVVLVLVSVGLWGFLWCKAYLYGALPESVTSEEKQKAQIDRMIALRMQPIDGVSSKYDYEKGKWK